MGIMFKQNKFKQYKSSKSIYFLIRLIFTFIISISMGITVFAQDIIPELQLSPQEQITLEQGEVILKGNKGDYIGQVIASGTMEQAWLVLTDYDHFQDFLPNVASSKIVLNEGDRKIFEQVNVVDLWLFSEEFTVQIEARETKPESVKFKQFKGDLKRLTGTWQIKQLEPGQILVTHTVMVEPGSNTEKPFFYGIYESSLEATLKAIAQEITKRSRIVLQN